MREAWCPTDALFVAPPTHRAPEGSDYRDGQLLVERGLPGVYRREIGWGADRTAGAERDESRRWF